MATLEELEEARRDLKEWSDRFDNYSGNNPEKYQADIRAATITVRQLETALKSNGTLPLTEQERLAEELDAAFPRAKSKQIVDHKGRRYQRVFWPLGKSRSGKSVTEWGRGWQLLDD